MSDYYNYVKEGKAGCKAANGLFSKVQIMIWHIYRYTCIKILEK